jgi:hypothetical protein
VLQKTELVSIDKLQQMSRRFGVISSMITQQEIAKFNKDEASKMKQEMLQLR